MPNLEEVYEQLKLANVTDLFGTKKEVKELPNILYENEKIQYATSGFYDGNTWLITCTDRRIIFLDKGMIFGLKQVEIPLEKVNSVNFKRGLMFGEIEIWDGASKTRIENCSKETVNIFAAKVNEIIEKRRNMHFNNINNVQSTTNNNDNISDNNKDTNNKEGIVEQLERLVKLKEKGILDEEEFKLAKIKIINS